MPFPHLSQVGVLHPGVHLDVEHRGARDARAHESRSDDGQPADLPRDRAAGRDPVVLLERGAGEEDLHQLAGDVAHREMAEGVVLLGEPGGDPVLEAHADGLQRGQRRGVVPSGALHHLGLGAAVDDAPPGRGVIEEVRLEPAARIPLRNAVPDQAACRRRRGPEQNARRHDLVHQSDPQRLRGPLALPGQDHVERCPQADQPRQALGAAGARDDAELHLGKAELGLGMIAGDAVVAGERELEAAAETGAVDRRDHGLGQGLDPAHHLLPLEAQPLGLGLGRERGELLDVGAGDEGVGLAGDEHDRLDVGLVAESDEQGLELEAHRRGERVDRLARKVQRDDGDGVLDVGGEGRH